MFGYESYVQGVNESVGCDASYVHSVLNPSHADAAVRIPEPFGRPSAVCQLRYSTVVKSSLTNGQTMIRWNPHRIVTSGSSTMDALVDGANALNISNYAISTTINANFPGKNFSGIASMHRLVSAEICVKYIGRTDESSGLLCAALVPEDLTVAGTNILEKVRDGYFYHVAKAQDGIRAIYLPLDNQDVEYKRTGVWNDSDTESSNKHTTYIIGYGLPADKAVFHVEATYNVEYIPDMSQIEILSTGVSSSTMLEESLQKITQASKHQDLVITNAEGFNFNERAAQLGGPLGMLLGGGVVPGETPILTGGTSFSGVLPPQIKVLSGSTAGGFRRL